MMTPERWQQIDQLYQAALDQEAADRSKFISSACGDDAELRREVESLLKAHEHAGSFIAEPALRSAAKLLARDQKSSLIGTTLAHYRIESILGAGGMGEVYLALDAKLNRRVALKLLPASFINYANQLGRFEQEARAASALNHPNIITIYEIGEVDGRHFIVTEFVDGQTLREQMTNTRMTVGEVIDIAAQIASALQAAHEAGIVHRDIKPENIMVRRDGVVKVLDFGLAKLTPQQLGAVDAQDLVQQTVQTNPGMVMGTVAYMSPEQAKGLDVDSRTDIWSLGVVLYEMVARRAPFKGDTPSHVIVSILENQPASLSGDSGVPAELERIISTALQKDTVERYQTASDMSLDLKNLKEDLTIETRLKHLKGSPYLDEAPAASTTAQTLAIDTSELSGVQSMSSAEYLLNGIKRHRASAVVASVVVVLLIASIVYFSNIATGGSKTIDSVAVLHFVNEGGNPDANHLASGFSESLINSLSQIPKLRVKSLNAVSRYEGQHVDATTVGRELNVQAVLFIRMSQQVDALEISTELVAVSDNSRLWGAQYKRKPSDLLGLQNEIVGEIAEKLSLNGAEKQPLTKQYTTNKEAYAAYLRGHVLLEKRTPPATEKSIEYLEQAIRLDPNYALAYADLGFAYMSSSGSGAYRGRSYTEVFPKAKDAVAKALEIDDSLAEAHTVLGHLKTFDRDWVGAERSFRRAVELNPNSGFVHSLYTLYLIPMKRFDEAVAESKRAVEIEPTSVHYNRNVAFNLFFARRYDEAIEQSLKTLELDPIMPTAYAWLAKSYQQKGLYDQAIEAYIKDGPYSSLGPDAAAELREAYAASGWKGFWRKALDFKMQQAKKGDVAWYVLAEINAQLGDKDQVFAALEKSYEEHEHNVRFVVADPLWDDLRSDPRYSNLVRRMGLEP
jgi:serine/threonine-protein kinase